MSNFQSIVTIETETVAQAEQVLAERLGLDETYGFPYTVTYTNAVVVKGITELTGLLRAAEAAAHGDSNDTEIEAWRDAAEYAAQLLGVNL